MSTNILATSIILNCQLDDKEIVERFVGSIVALSLKEMTLPPV